MPFRYLDSYLFYILSLFNRKTRVRSSFSYIWDVKFYILLTNKKTVSPTGKTAQIITLALVEHRFLSSDDLSPQIYCIL